MEQNKVVLLAMVAIFVLVAAVFAVVVQGTYYGDSYKKALAAEQPNKCDTPPGYTDESWREHMSHHPSQYTECLK